MVATGLACYILTMMGIKANVLEVNLTNATAEVTKHLDTALRRISKIKIDCLPMAISEKHRMIIIHTANACMVHNSLHLDI